MLISIKDSGKSSRIEASGTIEELLKSRGICTESVLVRKNGLFVPVEEILSEGDEIEVMRITSSG